MLASQFFLRTHREAPSEAELVSHKLMIRAGLIKKLGTGLYSWMPMGLRVIRKIEAIVRDEMNKAGAIEMLMPAIQPADLWQKSDRWEKFGPQMLKIQDRHNRHYCFGPTHEEVITDIARQEIRSYKQLPVHFYQIQTKFRDEIRPRFGVMRSREFIMKDGYSFHANEDDLVKEYKKMHQTYSRIFTRLGLDFRSVDADTGAIGGSGSHEFHVLADSGEDTIAYCPKSDYAANLELAQCIAPSKKRQSPTKKLEKVPTPETTSCDKIAQLLGVPLESIVKSLLIITESKPHLLLLRGDHTLNETKASKLFATRQFRFASQEEITSLMGCPAGYVGPVNIPSDIELIVDQSVVQMSDYVCGANEEGFHLTGVNFSRDLPEPLTIKDIRNVVAGDIDPTGSAPLKLCRGIEVGHIFQLKKTYADKMNAHFVDKQGKQELFNMGCYGIGISRIVAAAIEQNHDDRGIVWPIPLAPFQVAIATIGFNKNPEVKQTAIDIHNELEQAGIDVLLDDRDERPGVMFSDLDLIGIPYRITIGERTLKDGKVDMQSRADHIPLVPLENEMQLKVNQICEQILNIENNA